MRILIIYHFFYPDTVVSARIMSDLAAELAKTHRVTVYSSNALIRKKERLCKYEKWNDVEIKRFSRPSFSQSSNIGRVINSIFLQTKWVFYLLSERKNYDLVIVGTDPQFVWMMFPFIKLINHKIKIIHWCFDLYPEAVMVNSCFAVKALAALMKGYTFLCYRVCDGIVDIGECMKKRLNSYMPQKMPCTLTPWALKEPDSIPECNTRIREELFGNAKIGLLYSGTVGYAHDIRPFIELARQCRKHKINATFCFAGYGNCYEQQISGITEEDTNIKMVGFVSEQNLEERLAAADIHLVSLREGWQGIVVPSKFFGSLAMGRPVIFSGPHESEISQWCKKYGVGFYLDDTTINLLQQIENNKIDIRSLQKEAFGVYHSYFSKSVGCKKWKEVISSIP